MAFILEKTSANVRQRALRSFDSHATPRAPRIRPMVQVLMGCSSSSQMALRIGEGYNFECVRLGKVAAMPISVSLQVHAPGRDGKR